MKGSENFSFHDLGEIVLSGTRDQRFKGKAAIDDHTLHPPFRKEGASGWPSLIASIASVRSLNRRFFRAHDGDVSTERGRRLFEEAHVLGIRYYLSRIPLIASDHHISHLAKGWTSSPGSSGIGAKPRSIARWVTQLQGHLPYNLLALSHMNSWKRSSPISPPISKLSRRVH